jgi:hypothetical protein
MSYIDELRHAVEVAAPKLLALGDRSAVAPAHGKWSPRQIIGHLVDSASNNHQRFVRGQLQDELVFQGYAQEDWVRIGQYADAPWEDLVTLWRTFNLQLARVMERMPDEIRLRARRNHNFGTIGVYPSPGQPPRLDDVMSGYVSHLKHHLRQIFPDEVPWALKDGERDYRPR